MLFFNGFKKRKCSLVNNNIIAEGVSYPLEYAEEAAGYGFKLECAIGFLIIIGIIGAFLFGSAIIDILIIRSSGSVNGEPVSEIAIISFSSAAYIFALFHIYGLIGFSSYWKINGNNLLLLENSDGPDVRNDLERLKKTA